MTLDQTLCRQGRVTGIEPQILEVRGKRLTTNPLTVMLSLTVNTRIWIKTLNKPLTMWYNTLVDVLYT